MITFSNVHCTCYFTVACVVGNATNWRIDFVKIGLLPFPIFQPPHKRTSGPYYFKLNYDATGYLRVATFELKKLDRV
jgi:hypothetical protein